MSGSLRSSHVCNGAAAGRAEAAASVAPGAASLGAHKASGLAFRPAISRVGIPYSRDPCTDFGQASRRSGPKKRPASREATVIRVTDRQSAARRSALDGKTVHTWHCCCVVFQQGLSPALTVRPARRDEAGRNGRGPVPCKKRFENMARSGRESVSSWPASCCGPHEKDSSRQRTTLPRPCAPPSGRCGACRPRSERICKTRRTASR